MIKSWGQIVATRHARFDRDLAQLLDALRKQGTPIHCTAGCSGCCTLNVHTTLPEAAAVATSLAGPQWARVDGYLSRLREVLAETPSFKEFLRRHRSQAGPCPFLADDGHCTIYPRRPLACRALISTRDRDWCTVDFSTLHPGERQAFMSSLDPALVAVPTHYLAAPQDLARDLEEEIEAEALNRSGYSLSGNLPLLVHLCRQAQRSGVLPPERSLLQKLLAASGLAHPFLVTVRDG
ncbi:YkgJ family cysteine cluster protein [Desulfuromonas carbonis]|uniref:YkgJ family cysteine cluster protein n=1 Tax=Desulfuromonas sp. DDH964 TaxID=1823759 RepID=UPI00078B4A04|nr:YkgJ family cysteine cluster protein [Desulfuromonas sp. DDH964]AMV72468.1 hypothetical protein DBW_2126 [Desulfuromonas sp. DDH964]